MDWIPEGSHPRAQSPMAPDSQPRNFNPGGGRLTPRTPFVGVNVQSLQLMILSRHRPLMLTILKMKCSQKNSV